MYSLAFSSQLVSEQLKAGVLVRSHEDSNSVRYARTN